MPHDEPPIVGHNEFLHVLLLRKGSGTNTLVRNSWHQSPARHHEPRQSNQNADDAGSECFRQLKRWAKSKSVNEAYDELVTDDNSVDRHSTTTTMRQSWLLL
jgi:hypothetical protein